MNNKSGEMLQQEYPFIVNSVMEYVINRKTEKSNIPMLDLISDYCLKEQMDVALVGDAIADNKYFASFIKADCEHYSILKPEIPKEEDW